MGVEDILAKLVSFPVLGGDSNLNIIYSCHSSSIELIHPVKKNKLFIKANLPKDDLWSALPSCLDV